MFVRRHLTLLLLALPLYGACSVTYLNASGQIGSGQIYGDTDVGRPIIRLAPDPATTREAVIQVYGARVAQWHGYFGVHTWIAVKRSGADQFTVHEVTRDQLEHTGSAVLTHARTADDPWYGNVPELLKDVRGPGVDALIDRIDETVRRYPFSQQYRIWPGPNSNTFVAHVMRAVPELRMDLPATAVGKDYLGAMPLARTPSGTGGQFNLFGLAGVAAGWEEGIELNVFGLTFGIDLNSLGLKLPVLGRVGAPRSQAPLIVDTGAARAAAADRP